MSPFIMYSSQNPWNYLDMEVIMIKEDVKCLSEYINKVREPSYKTNIKTSKAATSVKRPTATSYR